MPTIKNPNVPKRKVEITPREPRAIVYSNQVGVSVSPWDFGLQFGLIVEADETTLKAQEQVCVYMSPQHTKAFLELLNRQVDLYEKQFGSIPTPKQTTILQSKGARR